MYPESLSFYSGAAEKDEDVNHSVWYFLMSCAILLLFFVFIAWIAIVVFYHYNRAGKGEPSSSDAKLEPFVVGDGNESSGIETSQEQRRSGKLLFCVASVHGVFDFTAVVEYCNYIVFSGFQFVDGRLVHPRGESAWTSYLKTAALSQSYLTGIDLHSEEASKPGSLLSRLDQLTPLLANLTASGVTALGVLNVDASTGADVLKPAFSAMREALKSRVYGETFLGVELKTSGEKEAFIQHVKAMQDIDIVILQTHLSQQLAGRRPCFVRPVSAVNPQNGFGVPSFSVAKEAEKELRNRPDLKIFLSSTLGAFWSVGESATGHDLALGRHCLDGDVSDMTLTCDPSTKVVRQSYDSENMCEMAEITSGEQPKQFLTFESRHSLSEKLKRYFHPELAGWALFEVQRDIYKQCPEHPNQDRLQFVSSVVRPPGSG